MFRQSTHFADKNILKHIDPGALSYRRDGFISTESELISILVMPGAEDCPGPLGSKTVEERVIDVTDAFRPLGGQMIRVAIENDAVPFHTTDLVIAKSRQRVDDDGIIL